MASSRLSLLSDEDVRKVAAFDITDTLDLNDPRFGSTGSLSFECPTCGMYEDQCIGHHASVNLGCYIFHPLIYKDAQHIINSTCAECKSKIMQVGNSKTNRCSVCQNLNFTNYVIKNVTKPKRGVTFVHAAMRADKESQRVYIYPEDVANILPRGYVISCVLVPPVHLRTPNDVEWSSDIQKLYEQLVQALRRTNDSASIAYIYAKIVGSTKKEGIMDLISGKDGIFRKIMLGKRLESCARAVITPDPFLKLDEVAVPKVIADSISVSIRVSPLNRIHMKQLASEEKLWWHKSKTVVHPRHVINGMRFFRALTDGDLVLFNRQPSLSRSSLLCFKTRIRADDRNLTFGMNPQVVSPFNADFDGDEMNLFVNQSNDAEMLDLCHVSQNVRIDGQTAIVPVQDVITGCYMMSLHDDPISDMLWQECIMDIGDINQHRTTHGLLRACIPSYKGDLLTKQVLTKIVGDVGGQEALDMIYGLQAVVERWLMEEGLSVSLRHMMIAPEPASDVDPDIFRERCYGRIDADMGHTQLLSMIRSGAKGSMMHASHISVALGQQYVNGREGVFCQNSYCTGLTPREFFGHQMAGREGVVSTGVLTSFTGYLNRKTSKIIADLKEQYNGTVGDDYYISSFTNYK